MQSWKLIKEDKGNLYFFSLTCTRGSSDMKQNRERKRERERERERNDTGIEQDIWFRLINKLHAEVYKALCDPTYVPQVPFITLSFLLCPLATFAYYEIFI